MKHFVLVVVASLCMPLAYAEKSHDWEQGTVVSQNISAYNAGAVAMPIGTTIAAVPITRRSNIVVVDTTTARYTWSEIGKNIIILPVNGVVQFYRDGDHFILTDSNNKKHKFGLIGMTVPPAAKK